MTKRYLGNIITQNPTEPSGSFQDNAAKGVWSLGEQLDYQKAGLWPTAGKSLVDITDVFSTYLYTGNGSTQTITNDIDFAGEGGLVWIKSRATRDHVLFDTERGTNALETNSTDAQSSSRGFTAFTSSGFSLNDPVNGDTNNTSGQFVSWTFRKAPKFFDVVTYTGNGAVSGSPLTINHGLNATVGTILVKQLTDNGTNWFVYHRSLGVNSFVLLNLTNAALGYNGGFDNITSTSFDVFGSNATNGKEFVAYLFAHNDGDGEFGPDGDQDIIKCGSVTSNSNGQIPFEDLGFEPQWIITKRTDGTSDWTIHDVMRGWGYNTASANSVAEALRANTSGAESGGSTAYSITPTGFYSNANFGANRSFIYIAIRRGPLVQPESATGVFTPYLIASQQSPMSQLGSPVDMTIHRYNINSSGDIGISSRLTAEKYMFTNTNSAEALSGLPVGAVSAAAYDYQLGVGDSVGLGFGDDYTWMWKRAPKFFDVVAYSGDAVAGRTVSHNLGVAPEMIWVKKRNAARSWIAYHSGIGSGKFLELDNTAAAGTASTVWYDTDPTSTDFTVGTNSSVNQVPDTYIAYLFASLPGISKLGSFSHTSGTPTDVDCGFTAGARFVLWKKTSATDGWQFYDTTRGITSGNDPFLQLNNTDAEVTGEDLIDPLSTGFTVSANKNSGDYIFYAIA